MTTVAVLGGGFTGAAVAWHLALADTAGRARIVVVEPRAALGAGLAYSSAEPAHRINVPAGRMSLDPDDPEAFARWLEAARALDGDPDALDPSSGHVYPRRALFGRYVADSLAPLLAAGRIVHRRERARGVRRLPEGSFEIALAGGAIRAERVVVATTHPPPAVPASLLAVAGSPGFVADPGEPDALERVAPCARVLVVGNGLTAADVVAALDGRGHRGPVLMLSRNGLRSRGHPARPVEPFGDFASHPSRTALQLLRRVRRAVDEAAAEGVSWHAVFDALRAQAPAVWQGLPERERRRLVRRLRSFWDVHRFRIAPQVSRVLDRLEGEGRLRSLAASLVASRPDPGGGLDVSFRPSGRRDVETGRFDAVINTTGPAHREVVEREPVRSLHRAGLLDLDRVGLGLAVGTDHLALDREGRSVPGLFVAGPLARGTVGELMGLPQVTVNAKAVAQAIAADLGVGLLAAG